MNVKELIGYLQRCDPKAEVVYQLQSPFAGGFAPLAAVTEHRSDVDPTIVELNLED